MAEFFFLSLHTGNGYPMAAVVTSKEIAAVLGDRIKEVSITQPTEHPGKVIWHGQHLHSLLLHKDLPLNLPPDVILCFSHELSLINTLLNYD